MPKLKPHELRELPQTHTTARAKATDKRKTEARVGKDLSKGLNRGEAGDSWNNTFGEKE